MSADITNAERANWALSALVSFASETQIGDPTDAISDLVTNLFHLARAQGLAPDTLAQESLGMMKEEEQEDEEGDMESVSRRLQLLLPRRTIS